MPEKFKLGHYRKAELAVDKPFQTDIFLKNTGKTPAKNVAVAFTIRPGSPDAPDFNALDKPTSRGVIFPNGDTYIHLDATRKTADKLPQDTYDRIKSGEIIMLVYGRVEYFDAFGYHHWATNCSFFNKDGGFSQCKVGNDIDK